MFVGLPRLQHVCVCSKKRREYQWLSCEFSSTSIEVIERTNLTRLWREKTESDLESSAKKIAFTFFRLLKLLNI